MKIFKELRLLAIAQMVAEQYGTVINGATSYELPPFTDSDVAEACDLYQGMNCESLGRLTSEKISMKIYHASSNISWLPLLSIANEICDLLGVDTCPLSDDEDAIEKALVLGHPKSTLVTVCGWYGGEKQAEIIEQIVERVKLL